MCLALVAEGWGENTGGGMGGDKFSIQAPQPRTSPAKAGGHGWRHSGGWCNRPRREAGEGPWVGGDWERKTGNRVPRCRSCRQVSLPLVGRGQGWGEAEGSALWAHPHPQSLPTRGREAGAVGGAGIEGRSELWKAWLLWDRAGRSPSPLWGGDRGGGGRGLGALGSPPPSVPPHKGEGSCCGCPALKQKTTVSFPTVVEMVR